jgi:hypothetical protein
MVVFVILLKNGVNVSVDKSIMCIVVGINNDAKPELFISEFLYLVFIIHSFPLTFHYICKSIFYGFNRLTWVLFNNKISVFIHSMKQVKEFHCLRVLGIWSCCRISNIGILFESLELNVELIKIPIFDKFWSDVFLAFNIIFLKLIIDTRLFWNLLLGCAFGSWMQR